MRTLRDVDIKGKNVLVRVDYNVPLEEAEDGSPVVASDLRIRASLKTLEYLRAQGAEKIILISHLGRPEGRDEKLSLRPVAERLAMILADEGAVVDFVDQTTGEEVRKAVAELPKGGILLLENLRFDPREERNDLGFAKEIVQDTGAEIFVQDGFAVTHRAHASTDAIARILPAVAGMLVEKEVAGLSKVIDAPERPLVLVLGGAKVDDKAPLVEKFSKTADKILVGGKIAVDQKVQPSEKIYVAEDFDEDAEGRKLDIGPVAASEFMKAVEGAKTVLWNGTLGKVEDAAFATSSEIMAKYLGEHDGITSVICGGDTAGYVEDLMEQNPELKYTLVSTGGGAALEFLSGEKMPGLVVLG